VIGEDPHGSSPISLVLGMLVIHGSLPISLVVLGPIEIDRVNVPKALGGHRCLQQPRRSRPCVYFAPEVAKGGHRSSYFAIIRAFSTSHLTLVYTDCNESPLSTTFPGEPSLGVMDATGIAERATIEV
jgi:hypothetical protein